MNPTHLPFMHIPNQVTPFDPKITSSFQGNGNLSQLSSLKGPVSHPYFLEYNDFQQHYNIWNPQYNANNESTSFVNMSGEFPINRNYRYAGGYNAGDRYLSLFCDSSIQFMSKMITKLLNGVHPEGKNIIVPDDTIRNVAQSVFDATGQSTNVMQQMIISYIVDYVKTEMLTIDKNNKLSIWITKYDEETGLKQFSDIKTNQKMRSPYFQIRY
jgi:hypothetical protein